MKRSSAEEIIRAASTPYHIFVGQVYSWNRPQKMVRTTAPRKSPRKKSPPKGTIVASNLQDFAKQLGPFGADIIKGGM